MSGVEKMIQEFTKKRLSSKRFSHVERVVETIEPIACEHGLDPVQARTAAWLHDCAKEESKSSFRELIEKGKIDIDPETLDCPKLWHGYHAAYWGEARFEVANDELLDAVRYHPTGDAGLSDYGHALFIADYCEPGRGLEGTAKIIELAKDDLKVAALKVVEQKIEYIRGKGKEPHSRSHAYREWLLGGLSN